MGHCRIHKRVAFVPLTRKKKIYYYSPDQEPGKGGSHKKKNKLWKMVWNTSKPLIAAYLAKEVAERVKAASSDTREGI
jgi:hypothetical protein